MKQASLQTVSARWFSMFLFHGPLHTLFSKEFVLYQSTIYQLDKFHSPVWIWLAMCWQVLASIIQDSYILTGAMNFVHIWVSEQCVNIVKPLLTRVTRVMLLWIIWTHLDVCERARCREDWGWLHQGWYTTPSYFFSHWCNYWFP